MTSAGPPLALRADLGLRLLGPVVAEREGRLLALGGPKQRAVLAALALQPGRTVSIGALVSSVWDDAAALAAAKTLQVYVANLRKALEPDRAPGVSPTLLLTRDPGYVLEVPPDNVDAARFERDLQHGRELVRSGALADGARLLREALDEWRGAALAGLEALPLHAAAARLEELRLDALELCVEAELDLGLHGALVPELAALVETAPYRERLRALLIRALYASGRQRDALEAFQHARRTFVEELGIEPGPELRELERRVLAQDPGLDVAPQVAVPDRRPRYEPLVRKRVSVVAAVSDDPLDAHTVHAIGAETDGTVIERRPNEIVTAFGVPRLAVDDIDRAAACALALSRRHPGLRVGMATGLVSAAGSAVSGAPVGRALELASRAVAGEPLIDVGTRELLGGRATADPDDDGAFVLSELSTAPTSDDDQGPFVGRDDELELLAAAWRTVSRSDRPGLITLIGEAGIGTSRLAVELAARIAAPVVRIPLDASATPDDLLGRLLTVAPGSIVLLEHAHRAARAASTAIARWADAAAGAVLCIATATPDLHGIAPSWPGPMPLALTLTVPPLDDAAAQRLAAHVLGDEVVGARAVEVAEMAGGNPLLVAELAHWTGDVEPAHPHRLASLFAARVDGLDPPARRTIEAVAVLGGETTLEELAAVASGAEDSVGALVAARLVVVDDDGAVSTHEVVADVVAAAMAEERAVELHQRAAEVSASIAARATHLELVARLAADDPAVAASVARATAALAELAWHTWSRGDAESAIDAVHRAITLPCSAATDVVASLRAARRRLASEQLAGRLGVHQEPANRTALGAWDAGRPFERDLAAAARALSAVTESAELREACDVVAVVLSSGEPGPHGSSASSSA